MEDTLPNFDLYKKYRDLNFRRLMDGIQFFVFHNLKIVRNSDFRELRVWNPVLRFLKFKKIVGNSDFRAFLGFGILFCVS